MTATERRLWYALRERLPVDGSHFRRQVPIAGFIVDFCCHKARIVIEVDGSQHGFDAAVVRDTARTASIEAEGYRVMRFWNADVWRNLDSVLDTIFVAMSERLPAPTGV